MHERANILIIDDEADICSMLAAILKDEGHNTKVAHLAADGLKHVTSELPDVVILDVWLPDMDGTEVLEKIRAFNADISVIMISGHANIETAVKSTRLGAVDFIEKPLSLDKVILSVENALRIKSLRSENQNLRNRFEKKYKLLGQSKAINDVRATIEIIASKSSTVLITGENGTGKEVVARQIHEQSLRSKKPFIAVNCAAIPEELIESELFGHQKGAFTGAVSLKRGKFELAHTGTLFLDEVADMSLKTQAKVLRVLQEQKFERIGSHDTLDVDVRVIAATNKNLSEEIKKGNFREDLFYRLNVIPIELLPLRERRDDIEAIAKHYLDYFSLENSVRRKVLSQASIDVLKRYTWPGNVRELKNIMERLSIMVVGDVIEPQHLPSPIHTTSAPRNDEFEKLLAIENIRDARSEFERHYISRKLEEFGQNISRTADKIGLERSHLHRKLKQFSEGNSEPTPVTEATALPQQASDEG